MLSRYRDGKVSGIFRSSRVALSVPSLAGVGECGLAQGTAEESSRGHLLAFIERYNRYLKEKDVADGLREDRLFASVSSLSSEPPEVVIVAMDC